MSRSYRRDVYDPALRLEHLPLDELLNNQNRRLDVADHALLNAFNRQLSEGSITSIGCIVDEYIDSAGEMLDEGVGDGLSDLLEGFFVNFNVLVLGLHSENSFDQEGSFAAGARGNGVNLDIECFRHFCRFGWREGARVTAPVGKKNDYFGFRFAFDILVDELTNGEGRYGGAVGNRTPDLYNAIVALSQLSCRFAPPQTAVC